MTGKLLTLYFVFQLLAGSQAVQPGWNRDGKIKPLFTISKETTYVKGPIDKQGYVDYVTAINKRLSKGVSPKDNANVLLWKAIGPRPEGSTMPDEYFKWLGAKQPSEKGKYFDTSGVEVASELGTRPWTPEQFPTLARWLKNNERPLELVIQATRRKQYYNPLVPMKEQNGKRGHLVAALLPNVQKTREFAYALRARAMMRTAQKQYTQAWDDLLACHRLARHIGRGGTLIENLVGYAIASVAADSSVAYLRHADLDAKQLLGCLKDLQSLPPHQSPAETLDKFERMVYLDCIMMLDREGVDGLNYLGDVQLPVPFIGRVDWDPALKIGNRWYDRIVATIRIQDRKLRQQKLDTIHIELRGLKESTTSPLGVARYVLGPNARGRMMGEILLCLLFPTVSRIQQAHERVEQLHTNARVAFALAAYRKDNGNYPKKLTALTPKYLPKRPRDVFSGKDLVYRCNGDRYLLYSIGINEKDEGGRSYEDDPPGDDLRVQMSDRK
ncbi:MAG: type II secretion system protein [Gemmataceae bacterium]